MLKNVDPRHYAALRIVIGIYLLLVLLQLYPLAVFDYSDGGWFPTTTSMGLNFPMSWSILFTVTSPFGVKSFFILSIVACLAMILGYRTRLATFLVLISFVSISTRNEAVLSGQDRVLRLMAFYLWLAPCGKAWSADSFLKRYRRNVAVVTSENLQSLIQEKTEPEHCPSWPLFLIQFQICIAYLYTGIDKLHGADWVQGTALVSALSSRTFARYNLDFLRDSPAHMTFLSVMTRITMTWELLFSALMFNRWTRWCALAMGFFIHLGIALTMQVNLLGYLMISSYAALLPADTFRKMADWLERKLKFNGHAKATAIFDGRSAFALRMALSLGMLDFTGRVEWKAQAPDLVPSDFHSVFHFITMDGETLVADEAYRGLIGEVPILFPLRLLYFIPGGRKCVSWVAANGARTTRVLREMIRQD